MSRSIRVRFAFTVGTNILRSLLSFSAGMLLARWIGPTAYGDMSFLLGTFVGLRLLLDLGSSTAFFTFLSQRPRSKRFVSGYLWWLAAQFAVPLAVIAFCFPARAVNAIWEGQPRGLVLLALAAAFMQNSAWPIVQQAGESQRETFRVQTVSVAVAAAHVITIVVLHWLNALHLFAVFAAIAAEYFLAAVAAHRRFSYAPSESDIVDGVAEPIWPLYVSYCLPLVPHAAVSFIYQFADRWLLQRFGGAVEQAYYAVGAQLSAVSLLATTSILRIFWKEVAEAHHRGDHERTGLLYQKVSRLLFLVGAIAAGFLMPWSADVLRVMLGPAYSAGATTLAIMFLYPVHQSLGQINGTMLYATQRVSLQVITGIASMVLSMIVTYFVLAPPTAYVPGLGWGSDGLAVKMVGVQIISVNVLGYLIARVWRWPFDWWYQPVGLAACVMTGWLAHHVSILVLGEATPPLLQIGVGGVVYILLITPVVLAMPWLAGSTRQELIEDLRRAWESARRLLPGMGDAR